MKLYKRTHMCGELRKENIGEKVVLNGWVAKRRNLGGLIFCDVRDKTGITQVVFNDKIPQDLFEQADSLRSEYVVGIQGVVAERESKNPDLPTGYIAVSYTHLDGQRADLAWYCRSDPVGWHGGRCQRYHIRPYTRGDQCGQDGACCDPGRFQACYGYSHRLSGLSLIHI